MITFRGGRLPANPAKARLKLGPLLTAAPTVPAAVNWDTKVSRFGVLGNDSWRDCVFAASYHGLQTWSANATTEIAPTDVEALIAYAEATGFDPYAGGPGHNPTDKGAVMQDALDYWRKTGLPVGGDRHRIVAFAEVDHTNPGELDTAAALFGEVFLGIRFPAAAMTAFDAGEPWDEWEDDGGIEGGHAVCCARYDTTNPGAPWTVITWGREQSVTRAFLDRYLDEAWVVIAPEWMDDHGTAPSGLDLRALAQQFTALTGDPFPVYGPDTPPEPPPRPGSLDVAVQALRTSPAVAAWLRAKHSGLPRQVAALVRDVVNAATP